LSRVFAALLVVWGLVTGGLAALVYVSWVQNQELHERNEVLLRLDTTAARACEDVTRVNLLYERQLNRLMDQLGLAGVVAQRKIPESVKTGLGGPGPGQPDVGLLGESDATRVCEARGAVRR